MKVILLIAGILIITIAVIGFKFSRFGLETPEYVVVKKDGAFEIREYPAMLVVSTPMENPDPQEGTSFMRLFRYISGNNESEQKIAMTTPVFTSQENGTREMSFVVPENIAETGAPGAKSELVEISNMAGGRFAAYRFKGAWDLNKFAAAKTALANWIAQQNLKPQGEPMIANYDPPFTPAFLKRNEILVRL